ncbi:MAG: YicC/YloC family endoribonuclease [Pseudomonadota bacterium]
MLKSMTAFASAQGSQGALSWAWEMRSVNGKGLDLRVRVPDWIPGLEQGLKDSIGKAVNRGNLSVSLKITREDGAGQLAVNTQTLSDVLAAIETVEAAAMTKGISLAPATAADVLSVRGVMEAGGTDDNLEALAQTLLSDATPIIDALVAMRASEGERLSTILSAQIDEIEQLTDRATTLITTRRDAMDAAFHAALSRVLDGAVQADTGRVAQEIALLAVKTDVTEELDRLRAHVAAARELLAAGSPVGRKLDFLAQEFNREANTLCSKSQNTELTQIGLALKTAIDQMREQVQNVE